jgi:hypothetical protein
VLGPKLLKSGFDLRQPVSVGVVLLKELGSEVSVRRTIELEDGLTTRLGWVRF